MREGNARLKRLLLHVVNIATCMVLEEVIADIYALCHVTTSPDDR